MMKYSIDIVLTNNEIFLMCELYKIRGGTIKTFDDWRKEDEKGLFEKGIVEEDSVSCCLSLTSLGKEIIEQNNLGEDIEPSKIIYDESNVRIYT